ncbi:SDR family oxidoreductase [Cytobacillus gottheilii]|uniref:SDR family oxidoreductase n=1 Tax=Cytobacillus gottheilii TaxID=859144 RepID=A0ABX8F8T9_9BACI|nr:SDR family oxidoreductase [Cytobacillus gottheilii]QVY60846.1 SDR family oxidoreductase [Cytobacillus gottheilii]
MNVLVVGAHGQIGQFVVKKLAEHQNFSVKAMVRKEEQKEELSKLGAEPVLASLHGSVEHIADAAEGCDAIVFTAGSGGQTGFDQTLLIDLDGAVKTIEAAEKAGIKRFIMVSALQAHNRENWNEQIKPYYVAKYYADKHLEASGLDYTIIRPGGLTNEEATGKITAAENIHGGMIPREDVASVIVAALEKNQLIKRSFDLISGVDTIEDALNNIG